MAYDDDSSNPYSVRPMGTIPPLDLAVIRSTQPPKIDFVLPSLPAGAVGILSGPGGAGKSMLALQLMFSVAAGSECDFSLGAGAWTKPELLPGRVAYFSIEDPAEILHSRLYHIIKFYEQDTVRREWLDTGLLDLIKVFPLSGTGFSLMNAMGGSTEWLKPIFEVCQGARLVFIDTMRRAHDSDENDNGKMSIFLKLIEMIAKETGASVVLLHHENKASMGDDGAGAEALRGASAIVDNARWVSRVRKMSAREAQEHRIQEADRHWYLRLSLEKTNYGPPVAPIWLHRQDDYHGTLRAVSLDQIETKRGGRGHA